MTKPRGAETVSKSEPKISKVEETTASHTSPELTSETAKFMRAKIFDEDLSILRSAETSAAESVDLSEIDSGFIAKKLDVIAAEVIKDVEAGGHSNVHKITLEDLEQELAEKERAINEAAEVAESDVDASKEKSLRDYIRSPPSSATQRMDAPDHGVTSREREIAIARSLAFGTTPLPANASRTTSSSSAPQSARRFKIPDTADGLNSALESVREKRQMIDLQGILSDLDELKSDVGLTKASLMEGGAALNEYNLGVQKIKSDTGATPASGSPADIELAVRKAIAETALPIDPEIKSHLDAINDLLYAADDAAASEQDVKISETERDLVERLLDPSSNFASKETKASSTSPQRIAHSPSSTSVDNLLKGLEQLERSFARDDVVDETKFRATLREEVTDLEETYDLHTPGVSSRAEARSSAKRESHRSSSKKDSNRKKKKKTPSSARRRSPASKRSTPFVRSVVKPLRRSSEVAHAPRHQDDEKEPSAIGRSSRSVETAIIFYRSKARELESAARKNDHQSERARALRDESDRQANRTNAYIRKLVPLLAELLSKQIAREEGGTTGVDVDVESVKHAVAQPLSRLLLDDPSTLSDRGDLLHVEATDLPDVATYVGERLDNIASTLKDADRILSVAEITAEEQSIADEAERRAKLALEETARRNEAAETTPSKRAAPALLLDPLSEVRSSTSVPFAVSSVVAGKPSDDTPPPSLPPPSATKSELTVEDFPTSPVVEPPEVRGTLNSSSVRSSKRGSNMHWLEKIRTVVRDSVLALTGKSFVDDRVDFTIGDLTVVCTRYFDVIDIDRGPLAPFCESIAKHCGINADTSTLACADLVNILVNIFLTTPNFLVDFANSVGVDVPRGLVSNSQYEVRIAGLERASAAVAKILMARVCAKGSSAFVTLDEVRKFVLRRNSAVLDPKLSDTSSSPENQVATWCASFDCAQDNRKGYISKQHFETGIRKDFGANIGLYGRIANLYKIALPEEAQDFVDHENTCVCLAMKIASSRKKDGLIDQEELWELAHTYETECREGNQFRAPGLVATLQKMPFANAAEGLHSVSDVARCLELFFACSPSEVTEMLALLS